ncbi:MAG TPA: prenyltransferase/squalene oxidase repeat-containing protein [Vicinamibacterales bacterium]|nr:prenyltransferase/squalene oxidase repeat-containing protein [Vicinamibacterales bacterium]
MRVLLLTITAALLTCSIQVSAQSSKGTTAIDKADPSAVAIAKGVDYLKAEVPKWKAEHPCYSCHNNGDATRALLVAASKGYDIGSSLDDTLAFLKQPAQWDQNKAPAGIDNKPLARLQFASALAVAERHGKAASTDIEAAAKLLVKDQGADGSWQSEQSTLGSPVTYGNIIATWSARSTLISSGMQPDNFTIVQADKWIRGLTPENVLDASGTILALELSSDVMAENQRRACLSILRSGQTPDGGWGPYVTAAPQVFDTAMAVLALSSLVTEPRLARSAYRIEELKEAVANGKKYIVSQQRPDGSWPETTRPANQESYAQRISTTGWAMLALMAP